MRALVGERRATPALAIAVAALCSAALGCGGGNGPEGSGAVDLTKRLAADADTYTAADLTTLRDDFDLSEEAEPLQSGGVPAGFVELAGPPFAGLTREQLASPDVLGALELGLVHDAASATNDGDSVTVLATDADTGDVGSNLGDLGYADSNGILSMDGQPSIRLEPGLIFAAKNQGLLSELPREPRGSLPTPLLDSVDGVSVTASSANADCIKGTAASASDERSGELAFLIDAGADASKLELSDSGAASFGEPEVDGDVVRVAVSADEPGFAAYSALTLFLANYDCG